MLTASLDDFERAAAMVLAIAAEACEIRYRVVEGDPASKARPRFGRNGRAYTSAESRRAEDAMRKTLKSWMPEPMTGNVAMACIFYRSSRHRIDVDNMLKLVCDAANDVLWLDDSQVTAVVGVVELDADRPRTLIAVAPHVSTMTRGTDATYPCAVCGRPILMGSKGGGRTKTCSSDCAVTLRGGRPLSLLIPCAECGEPFRRGNSYQRLCSPECRANRVRGMHKAKARPKSRCLDCGLELAHHRGGRCRECWRKSVKAP